MGRSSVSTFYLCGGRCFYGGQSFPRFGYAVSFLRVDVTSKVKNVVYWMSEILFAAEIAFRRLDGCVPLPTNSHSLLLRGPSTTVEGKETPPQTSGGIFT